MLRKIYHENTALSGQFRVLYSDHRYALVYDCWQLEGDGVCHPGAESVIAMSRCAQLAMQ